MATLTPSASLQKIQELTIPSKPSEDQLDGLIRATYTFQDASPINRFLFRPYWSMVSSKCPNFPPTFLLGFSFTFTVLNFFMLSYVDPSYSGQNIPKFVWFFSAVFHLAALTCSGVDAAGRLGRRTGDSAYSIVEYIDRILESLMLCVKTMCFLHVLGVGETGGLLSHRSAYGLLVAVLGCYLCQQWEASATGVYRTSTFIDTYELTVFFGFILAAMGRSGGSVLDTAHPFGRLVLAFLVLGILGSIGRTVLHVVRNPASVWNLNTVLPLISFVVVVSAQFLWTFLADYPTCFPYICWSTGIVISSIIADWILLRISKNPEEGFYPNLLSAAVVAAALFGVAVSTTHARIRILVFLCSFSTVWHAAYVGRLAKDLLYRVVLVVVETFFRQAGVVIVQFFGRKESRSRK